MYPKRREVLLFVNNPHFIQYMRNQTTLYTGQAVQTTTCDRDIAMVELLYDFEDGDSRFEHIQGEDVPDGVKCGFAVQQNSQMCLFWSLQKTTIYCCIAKSHFTDGMGLRHAKLALENICQFPLRETVAIALVGKCEPKRLIQLNERTRCEERFREDRHSLVVALNERKALIFVETPR